MFIYSHPLAPAPLGVLHLPLLPHGAFCQLLGSAPSVFICFGGWGFGTRPSPQSGL